MPISQYYSALNEKVSFTRQQASDFAKDIADDFNPLHDIDAKRFCVPGDLLFSLMLSKYGVNQKMRFTFSGMVTEDVTLTLPPPSSQLTLENKEGKQYLQVERNGKHSNNPMLIDKLTRSYVAFSGKSFPHILIPLLEEKGVMINPARPMVIYESMLIDLEHVDITEQHLSLEIDHQHTVFESNGKRGNICLAFHLIADGKTVGRGEKHMVLSGLKALDKATADTLVSDYIERKARYKSTEA